MTTDTDPPIRITDETDLLALVPYTLGFHPEQSLVLLLFSGSRPFQARFDLPHDPAELLPVVEELMGTVLDHLSCRSGGRRGRGVRGVRGVVVAYTDEALLAEAATARVVDLLEAEGVEVLTRLRADGARWWRLGLHAVGPDGDRGHPYDLTDHPLTTRGVYEGKVTFRSRDELAASLRPTADHADAVTAVAVAHASLGPLPTGEEELREEAAWARRTTRRRTGTARPLRPRQVARLLRAVADPDVRDVVWCDWTKEGAPDQVRFWREVVLRSPDDLVGPAAALCGLAAWLSGDGALAWCAVDRCFAGDPGHSLGRIVSDLLDRAVPPTVWRPVSPKSLRFAV
ncbi:DUF4192 domain-containing protein [Nocardioides caldifontis]|uniref:DUF4192 domain-containing protein n=1 Tax=Nocardioides caldifontis TaxID=2588938 RepID=UPI0013968AED|nr:DUF4192 domain-containing protein [Nocardioides caldifontis]